MSHSKVNHPSQLVPRQAGFSLLEVLVAMFVAAVAVAGVMALHARNLSQVSDNTQLMRAQTVLSNAAARVNTDADLDKSMKNEADDQKMTGVVVSSGAHVVADGVVARSGHLLTIQWNNHDADAQVWRCPLSGATRDARQSCLELWVLP